MKEHPGKKNEYEKTYRDKNKDRLNRKRKLWRKEHPDYDRNYSRGVRQEVLLKYGGKCVCCGEARFEFLAFDHKKGGGSKHRKKVLLTGQKFTFWLRKVKIQKDIQILCHNCNVSFGMYGYCPHHPENKRRLAQRCSS